MKKRALALISLLTSMSVQALGLHPNEIKVREFGSYPIVVQISNEEQRVVDAELRLVRDLNAPLEASDLIGIYKVAPQHKLRKKINFNFEKEGKFYLCAGYSVSSVYVRSCGLIQVGL